MIIKKALTDAISLGISSSRLPVREIIFLAAPHRGLNITALQTLVKGEATERMISELISESPTLTWLNQSFTQFARDIDILTCYENKPTKTAINVNGVWKREGPPVMMVSPDSARQYYPREKLVSADCDHSEIAKIKRGQNGIYPAVKAAIKHGLVSTAKIVAGAGDAMNESSRFESKFQDLHMRINQSYPPPYPPGNVNYSKSKESAIEPVPELPLTPETAFDPVEEPSITFEAAFTSTMTTNPQESSPPCEAEPEGPGVSTTSLLQPLTSNSEPRAQNASSQAAMVKESDVASLAEEEESVKLFKLDDDIEAMTREFNEDLKHNPKNEREATCQRCSIKIAASDYHYSCLVCQNRPFICQKCYQGTGICGVHNKKLFKREVKPWYCVQDATFCIDVGVTAEDNELIRALKQNNTIKIRQYAQNRTLLNSQDQLGYTPLHVAAELGLEEGTKLLIECGAIFETLDYNNFTPLNTAVRANRIRIVQILLDSGADIEIRAGEFGSRALHIAATFNMWHIVTLLLRRGAAIDAPSDAGTALRRAVLWNCRKCVETLLAAGADANAKGKADLDPPLFVACNTVDHETARYLADLLLDHGAAVDLTDDDGVTPLILAATGGHLDTCKSLLERHPRLDIESNAEKNALYCAARCGYEEILDLLIARGASCSPPKILCSNLFPRKGKWKHLETWKHFESDIGPATRERILRKLRAGKCK